jgi:hypothetical protein
VGGVRGLAWPGLAWPGGWPEGAPVLRPLRHAWKCSEVSLPKLGSLMCTLNDWLWSMKAPRSAAMSTRMRCLISHTVLYSSCGGEVG